MQKRHIHEHHAWRVKGPDDVFGARMVDGRLAANTVVYLGLKASGHLHQRHTAQVRGGDEADQITDDTTADGDDRLAALGAALGQPVPEPRRVLQALRPLARGNGKGMRLEARLAERRRDPWPVRWPDVAIAD